MQFELVFLNMYFVANVQNPLHFVTTSLYGCQQLSSIATVQVAVQWVNTAMSKYLPQKMKAKMLR